MVKTVSWPVDALRQLLDRILDETGMSQAQLASLVPMDQSALSKWRSGSSKPKHESLVAMGVALSQFHPKLGLGPDDLVSVVYPVTPISAGRKEDREPSPSDAEQAGMDAVDAYRAALRKELEPLREQVQELTEQVRFLKEARQNRDEAV